MTDLNTLRQHQLLIKLLGYAREQGQSLAEENLDRFVEIMDEREALMADLVTIETTPPPPANILPFPTIAGTGSDPDVRAAMGGLIRSILRQDDENEQCLRLQMDGLKSELVQLGRGRRASRGYTVARDHAWAGQAVDRAG